MRPSVTPERTDSVSRLQIQGLRKRYGSRVVVKDVSLEVSSGEVVGLLGPNGAGKTTCFYMIVGLIAVDGGAIDLDGREISHSPMHRRARMGLSYLPQEASVFRKLTVEENIRAVLDAAGATLGDVVHVQVNLLHMADFAEMNRAYAEAFTEPYPARTVIGVAALPKPGAVLTMNAIVVPARSR